MARIVVLGLINIETTVRVDQFPLDYAPVRYPFHGVRSTVSGVGYNISKALHTLGHEVRLCTLIGQDDAAALVQAALAREDLDTAHVLPMLAQTAQSAILYDTSGRRMILSDLKDIQEHSYPAQHFEGACLDAELAVLCNINFSRPYLAAARARGLPIATDVHTISDLDDTYNHEYIAQADILFMSDERLPTPPEDWARAIIARFPAQIVVIGLGAQGALLAVRADGFVGRFPAENPRPVINTVGAGDALFSAFLHGYLTSRDPYQALRQAILFAGYKIGATGAAEGFLSAAELTRMATGLD